MKTEFELYHCEDGLQTKCREIHGHYACDVCRCLCEPDTLHHWIPVGGFPSAEEDAELVGKLSEEMGGITFVVAPRRDKKSTKHRRKV